MLLNYKKFRDNLSEAVINEIGSENIDNIIDDAYKHFKSIGEPINTLDIINFVEEKIGKELDDDDYEEMYYKITGEELESDEIEDLEDEEKFIVK